MAADFTSLQDDLGDRYAIERELGHGATASVYLARDRKNADRYVAIKVLSPDFALAVPKERFRREIKTTAQLNHPHIVPLFDSDCTPNGRPFYVMRYIEGEVLHDAIARTGPFAVSEALRITRQVAGALAHAHRHGVIHRDIKPGNIMLEDGHTWVTDFGIARPVSVTESQTVTTKGVAVGTPAYMSPEQVLGDNLDGRTDMYSLACVLFEMLAGRMPFQAPDLHTIMQMHLHEPFPSIREIRPEVPEQIERLLQIATEKSRNDRFATALVFAEALSSEGAGPLTPTRTQPVRGKSDRRRVWRWTRQRAIAGGTTLTAGVIAVAAWMLSRPTLDESRYLVASPFEYGAGVNTSIDVERQLQDALTQWRGIKVVGRSQASYSGRPDRVARAAEAGWYIRGSISPVRDSLRVRAALHGTRDNSIVRERSVNLAANLIGADSAFSRLADQLLFEDTVVSANGGTAGTRSVAARNAFARGLSGVHAWELVAADSEFRRAADDDPRFAQAHLWLAQVRFWNNAAPATWRSSAERAAAARSALSSHDRLLSDGLLLLGRGDAAAACRSWERLAELRASDFAAWFGLASCLSRDDAVIPDPRSESGWQFRTSYHRITKAYQKAFQLLPSIHKALRGGSYEFVQRVLMTNASTIRYGHALPPDTTKFRAYPSWQGDTLALVPQPSNRLLAPSTLAAAVRHERELFYDIATAWVTAFPTSADAVEAVATSLDLLGDPSAIDSLRRARALAPTERDRTRLAGTEFWMRLRYAVPFDIRGIQAASDLADSLLGTQVVDETPEPLLLASIAAVSGRANLAAAFARQPEAAGALRVPAPLARIAGPLLVFAALGGPVDSLRTLEERSEAVIENAIAEEQQFGTRMAWLGRAGQIAFPQYVFKSLPSLAGRGDYMIDAQVALLRGDTAAVRRMYDERRLRRRLMSPGQVTLDALYPEAALLVALGDSAGAIAWLEPTLVGLTSTPTERLADPANAGALAQAMALRAELARQKGDRAIASRWAGIVRTLWANADPPLQRRAQSLETGTQGRP